MNQSLYDHSYGFPRDELRLVPVGPSPGRGGENQEPYDVVMSELVEVLIWIDESLLSSRSTFASGQGPIPGPLHSASQPSEYPRKAAQLAARARELPVFPQWQPPGGGGSR